MPSQKANQPQSKLSRVAGRPLDEQVHRAIIVATLSLLAEQGYPGLTMEGIARRAGVGKPAIYRRWKHKALLVFDAVFGQIRPTVAPSTGSLEADLTAFVAQVVGSFEHPVAVEAIAGLIVEFKTDAELHQRVLQQWLEPVAVVFDQILKEGLECGEVKPDVDPRMALDSVAGMIFFRMLMIRQTLDPDQQRALVRMLLSGIWQEPNP